jgi:hypothetical protein
MFGPENTGMLKILALLTCSNGSGKWLSFDKDHVGVKLPLAFFDLVMPNCLVIHHGDNSNEKVYNNPTADAGDMPCLIDETAKVCTDWADSFGKHPVKQMSTYPLFVLGWGTETF